MKKFNIHFLALFFSVVAIIVSSFTLIKLEQFPYQQEKDFIKTLLERTRACVLNDSGITKKNEILTLIDALEQSGSISEIGSDDLRIKYVFAQGSIEHVLACAMVLVELKSLIGVIHTPTPATPLCTKVENLDEQLLDSSIRFNLEKLLTVRSRAVIVREYLENGGKLFVAYPQGGLEKRTLEQQEVYRQELNRYADRLFDAVLSCTEMDPSKIGASYFFKSSSDEVYAFSIRATQANNPKDNSEWGLWFGKITDLTISERVNEILDYLEANDGPQLRKQLITF